MAKIPDGNSQNWTGVPIDFTYPWGSYWMGPSQFKRPKSRPKFMCRKLTAFQRKMLDRITSNAEPDPVHPDQLYLF